MNANSAGSPLKRSPSPPCRSTVPAGPRPAALVPVGGLGVVVLRPGHCARSASSGHPGGDGARGGLLGHAVVADHRVEAAPGVGVLGGVVGLQRGRDAALVLRGKQQQDQPMRTQKPLRVVVVGLEEEQL